MYHARGWTNISQPQLPHAYDHGCSEIMFDIPGNVRAKAHTMEITSPEAKCSRWESDANEEREREIEVVNLENEGSAQR